MKTINHRFKKLNKSQAQEQEENDTPGKSYSNCLKINDRENHKNREKIYYVQRSKDKNDKLVIGNTEAKKTVKQHLQSIERENCPPIILHPVKIYFENKKEIKISSDLEKWKEFIPGRPVLWERKWKPFGQKERHTRWKSACTEVMTGTRNDAHHPVSAVTSADQRLWVCSPNPHLPFSSGPPMPTRASFSCDFF